MKKNLLYDETSPISIESYAKKLIGKTFEDVIGEAKKSKIKNKGRLGQLLEKYYFLYELNSDKNPDFKEAGVELKVTGYVINKSNKKRAKERLVLNIINFNEIYLETFDTSSFLQKNSLLLLVFYHYKKGVQRLDFTIDYVQLFQFPEKDLKIIRDDWNTIVNKIRNGKAHELSEGDTNYLGACTKGASSKSVREQPFNNIMAKQRAFSLKQGYLTQILNDYIIKGKKTYDDSVIKDIRVLDNITFEQFVIDKINYHRGKSIANLANEFDVNTNPTSKSYVADITKSILGVEGKYIEEFEKANIKIKTIRINQKGTIKEHMSFPTFKFTEIINEDWESSTLREMFLNTRFLFVIYRFDKFNDLRLEKCMFWNVPHNDLEYEIKEVWKKTISIIKEGIRTKKVGKRTTNNLPSASSSSILHVRPHARNKKDTYPLPNGGEYTKQCFWLNNSYILRQILNDESEEIN
ncbi:restriction endonuclease [Senegalia massiliensis]|uniref:Restriction endonuclease n=1 Tax=Senegalia massiliensis TaxID=1720316 RepID=A0A845QU89_9CLOT|nr:restriction endonuclease [Senegalia massiliensis]